MEDFVDRVLNFDPIAEAERLVGGKHWSEFTDKENAMMLLVARISGQNKERILQNLGDTFWGMGWAAFKDKLLERGFKLGLSYNFQVERTYDNSKKTEEAIIYYNPSKGIVVFATSYGDKTSINGGTAYAEVKAFSDETQNDVMRSISSGGFIHGSDNIFETSWDIREGMFRHIERMEQYADFQSKWINKQRFLWFVDYAEEEIAGYDYKEIAQRKIAQLPAEARAIID